MSTSPRWKLSICLSSVLAGGTFLDVILNLNQKRSKAIYNSEYLSPPAMWLWLAPAVLLSQWGRQSRNSSIIASRNQGCITWGPITSCANNVLTDAGGLLLLLPANLWLITLIKLEVNLPFKDVHPTPTEIGSRMVQRWLSPLVSPNAHEVPPLCPLWFPDGKGTHWAGASQDAQGKREGVQRSRWRFLPHTLSATCLQNAAFQEVLSQKLHFVFDSPQGTASPKFSEMNCLGHNSMAEKGPHAHWSNYKDLLAGLLGYLLPRFGSFAVTNLTVG